MKQRPAFTLVELLVYLSISSIVVLVLTSFAVAMTSNAARQRDTLELQANGRAVINKINPYVRSAVPPITTPSGSISITNPDSTVTVFRLNNNIVEQQNNGGGFVAITRNTVRVTTFTPTVDHGVLNLTVTISPASAADPASPLTLTTSFATRRSLY